MRSLSSLTPPSLRFFKVRIVELSSGSVVLGKAKEDIAGSLHHLLPFHHTAALVSLIAKLVSEPLQYRALRLLDLNKQRFAIAGHEQSNAAERPDRAYSDCFEGQILIVKRLRRRRRSGARLRR